MLVRIVMIMIGLGVTSACIDESSESDLTKIEALIKEKRNQWLSNGLSNYSFTYSVSPGDCPNADAFPPVEITVENNVVVRAYASSIDSELNILLYPSIDHVFNLMLRNIELYPKQYSATKEDTSLPKFDDNLYFPTSYYVDMSSQNCDALFTRITNFL